MQLKLIKPYKSIKALESKESLPDFTLITGRNGAGKTQLLKMINGVKEYNRSNEIKREISVQYGKDKNRIISTVYFDYNSFSYDRWSNDSQCLKNDERKESQFKGNENEFTRFTDSSLGDRYSSSCSEYLTNELKYYREFFNTIYFSPDEKDYQVDVNAYRKAHTPPWKLFAELLKEYNNNHQVNESVYAPLPITHPKDGGGSNHQFLISEDGVKLEARHLSTGEKALMGLCYLIYVQQQKTKLPELLLLDEIDSTLHPSVIKSLLNAIQVVFVKKYGLKVIMVTHSPTTVALARKESIFVLERSRGKHKLVRSTQRRAIDLLLEGVNTISIDPINTKQVFVESDVDARIYSELYRMYRKNALVTGECDLAFVSSGVRGSSNSGSCTLVKKTVKALRKNGNTRIYGLIDRDNKSESGEDGIFTLKRYSIENYILDPLILLKSVFSLSENRKNSARIIPLEKITAPGDVDRLSKADLQKFADHLADYLGLDNTEKIEVKYPGKSMMLPSVFIKTKGHDLLKIIKTKIPFFKNYGNDEQIMIKIIGKINDQDGINYLPKDLCDIFNDISNRKH